MKEKYICNGKFFDNYDDVVNYAASINCRVSNTETIRKNTYLITLESLPIGSNYWDGFADKISGDHYK